MASFADMFEEAKVKEAKATKAKKTAPAEEKKEPAAAKEEKPAKVHPKDDPDVRKARKERRKKEWVEKREAQKAADKKEDVKKEARRERQEMWNKARETMKKEEQEAARYDEAVGLALEGVARLQAMIASGCPFDFRGVSDLEYLEQNSKELKGKQNDAAERICTHLDRLAKRVQKGNLSPFYVAGRLANVTSAFMVAFDDLLRAGLEEDEGKKMVKWMQGHRSSVIRKQQAFFANAKEFVPVEMTAEEIAALDQEEDAGAEEAEEAPEMDEDEDEDDEEDVPDARGGKDGLTAGDVDALEELRRRMTGEDAPPAESGGEEAGSAAEEEDAPAEAPKTLKRKAEAPAPAAKKAKKSKKGKGKQ